MIETARLILRRPVIGDLPAFAAYYGTERSHFNGGPLDAGKAWRAFAAHLGAWEINGFGMFVFAPKDGGAPLGLAGAWFPGDWPEAEIGWTVFLPENEGKGLAAEASRAAIAHAFGAWGWKTAVSYIDDGNLPSRRLAERLGAAVDPDAALPARAAGLPVSVYRHPRPAVAGAGTAG